MFRKRWLKQSNRFLLHRTSQGFYFANTDCSAPSRGEYEVFSSPDDTLRDTFILVVVYRPALLNTIATIQMWLFKLIKIKLKLNDLVPVVTC